MVARRTTAVPEHDPHKPATRHARSVHALALAVVLPACTLGPRSDARPTAAPIEQAAPEPVRLSDFRFTTLTERTKTSMNVRFRATGLPRGQLRLAWKRDGVKLDTTLIGHRAGQVLTGRDMTSQPLPIDGPGMYEATILDDTGAVAVERAQVRALRCYGYEKYYANTTPSLIPGSPSRVTGPFWLPLDMDRRVVERWFVAGEFAHEEGQDYTASTYPVTRAGTDRQPLTPGCPWVHHDVSVPRSLSRSGPLTLEIEVSGLPGWKLTFSEGLGSLASAQVERLPPGPPTPPRDDGNTESPVPAFAHEIRAIIRDPQVYELRSAINRRVFVVDAQGVVDTPGLSQHERIVQKRRIDAQIARDRARMMRQRAKAAATEIRQLSALVREVGGPEWTAEELPAALLLAETAPPES